MHLGVVMTGAGAHAAACAGVQAALKKRGVSPCAVCGMQAGAWPAALYAAGLDAADMGKALHQAASAGRRMIAPVWYERLFREPMPSGRLLGRLLDAQTQQLALSACSGTAVFPCVRAAGGRRVLFATRPVAPPENGILMMQATAAFAARCAMALPPFLAPMSVLGGELLPEYSAEYGCRLLHALGASHVLVVQPVPSPRRAMDAMELACARAYADIQPPAGCAVLRMEMEVCAGALGQLEACFDAGMQQADVRLDALLGAMGASGCRILPFRRMRR